jgi:cell division septal protein FtsQ
MKTIFSKLLRKKKLNSVYLYDRNSFSRFAGNNHHNGRKFNRINEIKKWLATRKRKDFSPGYGQSVPVRTVTPNMKAIAIVALTIALLVAGSVFVFPWMTRQFASISLFQVNHLVFNGVNRVSKERLREASGIIPNKTSMFGVDTEKIQEKVMTLPWVAQATVKRRLPSTIQISVVENDPVALLHTSGSLGGQLHYIDRDGRPFLAVTPGADIDFPVITGLSELLDTSIKQKAQAEVLSFLTKIKNNNPYLPSQLVSEIHVDDHGEMIVYLIDYPFPIFLGNGNKIGRAHV